MMGLISPLAIFEPSGYITAANASDFQEQLINTVTVKERSVFLVDMSAVEFLDSAGLMALVTAFRLAASLEKSFHICSIPPSVRIIFELTQLDRVLSIYSSRAEFEASLLPGMAA
jgi:anti-anti-sigma factor